MNTPPNNCKLPLKMYHLIPLKGYHLKVLNWLLKEKPHVSSGYVHYNRNLIKPGEK